MEYSKEKILEEIFVFFFLLDKLESKYDLQKKNRILLLFILVNEMILIIKKFFFAFVMQNI